jgi:hypothetical protein
MPPFLRVNTATFPSNAGIILSLEDSVRAGDTSGLAAAQSAWSYSFVPIDTDVRGSDSDSLL